MKSSLQIAAEAHVDHIGKVAERLGIPERFVEYHGRHKAKIDLNLLDEYRDRPKGKYILVTAITPTPLGEGKTTTTIGLGMALNRLGQNAAIAIRQSSLGPVFGIKGGGAGGGYSQRTARSAAACAPVCTPRRPRSRTPLCARSPRCV